MILTGCHSNQLANQEANLENAVNGAGLLQFMEEAYQHAIKNVEFTTIETINQQLRPYDRIYKPGKVEKFPVVLFFHGCSGPTLSHEQDWANFYNAMGVVMMAIDSYSGRGINPDDACNFTAMTPWQRAADVFASIEYVKTLDYIDTDKIILSGFSHGAMTLWQAQVYGSRQQPPLSLAQWKANSFDGLKYSFLFYGTCMERWDIKIPTTMFLGGNDRYIDQQICINYAKEHQDMRDYFQYFVFENATHTFDHATPSEVNIEAGSVYDEEATKAAQKIIAEAIANLNPGYALENDYFQK